MTETRAKPLFGGKSYQPLPWNPLPYMEEYLAELAGGETPHSPDYIRPVKAGLARFAEFAAGADIKHPDEITRAHLLRYQAHLTTVTTQRGGRLQLAYRQKLMAYLRGWINWLVESQYMDESPWVNIRVGRVPKKPKPLEDDEVAQLFATHRSQAFSIPPFAYHRREVILVLLYGWGLRIHELASLNVAQLPMTIDTVRVINKGGGTKRLPYTKPLKDAVLRWLPHRAKYATFDEDALIIDNSGGRLSIPRIRSIVVDLGLRANVAINPHRLRDTFGTALMDGDVPVERIMELMGHTQRAQTLAYSKIRDPKLAESHERVMGPILDKLLRGPIAPGWSVTEGPR